LPSPDRSRRLGYFAVGVMSPTASITCTAALAASPRATSVASASAMPASSSSRSGEKPAETGWPAGGLTATVAWGPSVPIESSEPTA
jgi:hypothetical protein